jgi:hypothetical protein
MRFPTPSAPLESHGSVGRKRAHLRPQKRACSRPRWMGLDLHLRSQHLRPRWVIAPLDIVMLHLTDPDEHPQGSLRRPPFYVRSEGGRASLGHAIRGSPALYPCGLQRRFFASWGGCMGKSPSAPQTRMVPWDAFLRAAVRLCKAPGFQSAPLTRMVEPFLYLGNHIHTCACIGNRPSVQVWGDCEPC